MPSRVKQPLVKQVQINHSWGMDFMSVSMVNGRRFRTFNLIDDCTREVLDIEMDTSLSSKRIIRILEIVILERGKPIVIITHNGLEFTSKELELWAKDNKIQIQFIQPGRPMQNGYIERFNRVYRKCILDVYPFFELDQVRQLTEE
jgi:putative transposase